ncbi:hypothetical protein SDRG_04495 [Saprolegnia diclina VS20]|uniref:RRM domain-containing protein n=1 Tax=Saprolegnia diclina (strain VS20) TaxID=1156394 RepID=T0QVM5_SAPDV|nr:hypothetical protein SDRG_04495 [Saprolegnia diclina VS20]EQC38065.1 hypothetical protein SDRG_04495 [Saprolegnia diclina VS20]|eukprot:XP_008608392.1 hypothetical protein SDRG_04495 [Saprolegnia diclina VS20]
MSSMDDDIDKLLEQGLQTAKPADSSRSSRSSRERHSSRRDRRSRSRSRERRSSRRDRDRSRDRHSSRRSRRSPSRSRSRDSRRRSRRSNSRSKSKSKEKTPVEPPRARSTSAERLERAKQRELMELTRDHRTIFVGQLTQKVRERDLEKFFSSLGKLEHVLLIRDKFTNKSKGFAYVEFSNLEDIPKVLTMNGQVPSFQSFPIMIKASEAEKNFAAKKDAVFSSGPTTKASASGYSGGASAYTGGGTGLSLAAASRVYCGNLHNNITEEDLKAVFSAFGDVVNVIINRDDMGRSKGFSFIQFSSPEEANLALTKANGLELAGNFIKVGPVKEGEGVGSSGGHTHSYQSHRDAPPSAFNNKNYGGSNWKLEDEEGTGGMALNSVSRSQLMAKLAGGAGLMPPPASASAMPSHQLPVAPSVVNAQNQRAAASAAADIEGIDSMCFVVRNMFELQKEKRAGNPDWHTEIQQDVEDECSRYGKVLHSYVEKAKEGGLVYICFATVSASREAAHCLHGRWFNCRQISVRFMPPQEYAGMFPEARAMIAAHKH